MFAVFGVIAPSTADHVCRFWGDCPKHGSSCLPLVGPLPQAHQILRGFPENAQTLAASPQQLQNELAPSAFPQNPLL